MPLYSYDCLECKGSFSARHSYKAEGIVCVLCGSGNIQKNLSSTLTVTKKEKTVGNKKVGHEVNKAIQDGKQELNDYKRKRKNRVFKNKP